MTNCRVSCAYTSRKHYPRVSGPDATGQSIDCLLIYFPNPVLLLICQGRDGAVGDIHVYTSACPWHNFQEETGQRPGCTLGFQLVARCDLATLNIECIVWDMAQERPVVPCLLPQKLQLNWGQGRALGRELISFHYDSVLLRIQKRGLYQDCCRADGWPVSLELEESQGCWNWLPLA